MLKIIIFTYWQALHGHMAFYWVVVEEKLIIWTFPCQCKLIIVSVGGTLFFISSAMEVNPAFAK